MFGTLETHGHFTHGHFTVNIWIIFSSVNENSSQKGTTGESATFPFNIQTHTAYKTCKLTIHKFEILCNKHIWTDTKSKMLVHIDTFGTLLDKQSDKWTRNLFINIIYFFIYCVYVPFVKLWIISISIYQYLLNDG